MSAAQTPDILSFNQPLAENYAAFVARLVKAGWSREDAEREARQVLIEGRDDEESGL